METTQAILTIIGDQDFQKRCEDSGVSYYITGNYSTDILNN